MSKTKGLGIKLLIISLILSVLCFSVLLFIQVSILSGYKKVDVVRAKCDIEEGIEITANNVSQYFEVVTVPEHDKIDGAYTSLEQIKDVFLKVSVEHKEQITLKKCIRLEEDVLGQFENPCEISYKAEAISAAVSGTLRRGDYVSVYRYDETDSVLLISESVFISGAYTSSGIEAGKTDGKTDDDPATVMFTFIVEKDQVEALQKELVQGNVFFVKIENVE